MTKITIKNRVFDLYLDEKEIDEAVSKVAKELNNAYISSKSDKQPPILVSILSGAYMFTSDLIKKLTFESEVSFIKVSSYSGLERTKNITTLLDINQDVKGRDLILIDEIVDSGNTLKFLKEKYLSQGAASVTIAALIYKPKTLKCDLNVDFIGFEMKDDAFLVGYGLDYD